jgi:tRNA A37 threonylcarbamoyladenosine dehydratase
MWQPIGMTDYQARFGGLGRLYGAQGQECLRRAHVCLVGIGGVGSWAVEALARSGIGTLTIVDLDDVCISNVNRQAPALSGQFGKPKVEAMQERILAINPGCTVHPIREFFSPATADKLLRTDYDFLFDAIDDVANKCLLLASCRDRRIPVITTGGAGGRRDPCQIRVADLSRTTYDRLLQDVRKRLRKHHAFPRLSGKKFMIDCVFSPEPVVYPRQDGSVCAVREEGADLRLDCRSGYGTASFVTGAFGFAAAAHIVRRIVESPSERVIGQ